MDYTNFSKNKLRKPFIALALALLAVLSYLYNFSGDRVGGVKDLSDAGILTAVAKEDASVYKMFLKVDTVTGDSADEKHRSETDADSFAWQIQRDASSGRPAMDGFRVTMRVSKASPSLFLYGAAGTRVPKVILAVRRDNSKEDFLKWILTDVYVASFKTVGNTQGDGLQDEVVFGFSKIEVEYKQTDGKTVRKGWDIRTNKSS
ncbi:hypothetical protein A3A67_00390 [Candidatus Peribacteria bacterium RIFCSPLOWO2_01_FULL_51_18]|nr:MAG: hypothetical protein A3A67_00390 [Candidatus Peribacteria bacterium RIFCSPLOWO2_01_FULL_51_18]OGJ69422.1 MAG: hypothetical protein A3J34_05240 [Candidatus Peribacteria bacterium RIFCSPLOWO2_02_FULL_51_10]